MLVGSSVLVAVGLHRFYEAEARIPSPTTTCPAHPLACPAYERASTAALLSELHTIFAGAAVCALAAALLCPLLVGRRLSAGAGGTTTSSALRSSP
jgi:hypothetical protein